MSPSMPVLDARNLRPGDTVLASDVHNALAGRQPGANDHDLLPRQLGMRIPLTTVSLDGASARGYVPSLADGVPNVLGLRPEEQMVGPNAARVVAGMADLHPLWDWPVETFPQDSMRAAIDSVLPEIAVSMRGGALPLPTTWGTDERPEASVIVHASMITLTEGKP